MLVFKRDRILVVLSTIGFARSYVAPRVGAIFGYNVRSEHQRVYRRRGCSTNLRGTNDVAGPSSGVGEDGDVDEWDTWEFGSWKRGTHAENMAEAASRISTPQIPKLMGADVGVDIESKEDLEKAIGILAGFLTKDRLSRMQHVLDQRTASATVVFENPSNPNNVWACLRTLDSFGIQNAHVVADPSTYTKKARLKVMCTAMGSNKWLTLRGHDNPEEAVSALKAKGYQVVASDLSPTAVPIGEIDWSVPTAVVLGNEERGISDSMRNLADATFVIPMKGFVRSFNMSVACSVILSHLSAVRALKHGDLSESERRKVTVAWLMQSVKGSDKILGRHGIVVPEKLLGKKSIAGYHVSR